MLLNKFYSFMEWYLTVTTIVTICSIISLFVIEIDIEIKSIS